jgi:uncharacterized protein involved in exopolysaccharide biosynthesis
VDKDVPVIRINYKSNVPEKASLLVNTLAETYIQDYIENKYRAANTTVDFLKMKSDRQTISFRCRKPYRKLPKQRKYHQYSAGNRNRSEKNFPA